MDDPEPYSVPSRPLSPEPLEVLRLRVPLDPRPSARSVHSVPPEELVEAVVAPGGQAWRSDRPDQPHSPILMSSPCRPHFLEEQTDAGRDGEHPPALAPGASGSPPALSSLTVAPTPVRPPRNGITYVNQGRCPAGSAPHALRPAPDVSQASSTASLLGAPPPPPPAAMAAWDLGLREGATSPSTEASALTPSSRGSRDAARPFGADIEDPLRRTDGEDDVVWMDVDLRPHPPAPLPGVPPEAEQVPPPSMDLPAAGAGVGLEGPAQPVLEPPPDMVPGPAGPPPAAVSPANAEGSPALHRVLRAVLVPNGDVADDGPGDLPDDARRALAESQRAVQEAYSTLLQALDGFDAVQRAVHAVRNLRAPLPANPITAEEDTQLQGHRDTLGQLQESDGDVPEDRVRKSQQKLEAYQLLAEGLATIIQRTEDAAAEDYVPLFAELTQQSQALADQAATLGAATSALLSKCMASCERLRAERQREAQRLVEPLRAEVAETLWALEGFRNNYLARRSKILEKDRRQLAALEREADTFDPLDEDLGAHKRRITDLKKKVEDVSAEVHRLERQRQDTEALRVKLRVPHQRPRKRRRETASDDGQPCAQRPRTEDETDSRCVIS
eukprot:EG_transcript_5389